MKLSILKLYQNKYDESMALFLKYHHVHIEAFEAKKILQNDLLEFKKLNPNIPMDKFYELLKD